MYYLLIEKFNNYNNRFLKRFDTVQEYVDYCTENSLNYSLSTSKDTNFNKNDNIHATHVFNENLDPSYLIWFDKTSGDIISRWFVLHYTHLSGNQFRAELKRDVLADNKEEILESPCYIEKGYVDSSDPAIFNKEDVLLNQIKTSETLLRDDSKTSWIVGYIAQDHPALSNKEFTLNSKVDMNITSDHTDWDYAGLCDGSEKTTINPESNENKMRFVLNAPVNYKHEFMFNGSSHSEYSNLFLMDWWDVSHEDLDAYRASDWYSSINWATCMQNVLLDQPSWVSREDFNYLYSLLGKKIQFNDGIYTLSISQNSDVIQDDWSYWDAGNLYNYLYGVVNSALQGGITGVRRYPVAYKLLLKKFRFTLTQVTDIQGIYKYSIPQTVRKLEDAPYKMFCIPYYKDVITTNPDYGFSLDGLTRTDCSADLMLAWAFNIAKEFGNSLYDLQILPYCPLSNWRGRSGVTNAAVWSVNKTEHVDYEYLIETIEGVNYSRGVISFCDVSTKEQVLDKYAIVIGNPKIANQCYSWRLCSPNYASVFEFNASENGGVNGYNVRYTYKPFQPFINVAPIFEKLYGKDFKDNRGLILSGDFSLPVVTDAWVNYQLNNKNYLLAFDRQIETLELQQDWQFKQGVANAITGTLKGGTTGGMAGGMVGGPWGAVAGAVVGTVASGVGGVMDLTMQKELQRDAKDYAKDNFKMNIQNIHALPNTLNKVSSLVATSKLFPFVEFYKCTDTEIEAFRNKLKYNGYTIERIGFIKDFLNPSDTTFIKAKLIRNETITCDADELLEIANELNKGVFIE